MLQASCYTRNTTILKTSFL